MDNFDFFITHINRPADYYIGCCDGSVYIDFSDCDDGTVCLVRISFDGYGCCNLKNGMPLNNKDSEDFKKLLRNKVIDQNKMEYIVKKAISLNASMIWTDALTEYRLI